jgi:hypothetical protein
MFQKIIIISQSPLLAYHKTILRNKLAIPCALPVWTGIKKEVNPLHPLHHQRAFETPQQVGLPQFQLVQWHLQV